MRRKLGTLIVNFKANLQPSLWCTINMCIQYTRSMCILHVYVTNALNPLKFLSASVHEKWESIQSDDVQYLHGISFWSVMLHSKLRVYRQIVSLLNEDNETWYCIVTSLVYIYKRHYLQHCLHFGVHVAEWEHNLTTVAEHSWTIRVKPAQNLNRFYISQNTGIICVKERSLFIGISVSLIN